MRKLMIALTTGFLLVVSAVGVAAKEHSSVAGTASCTEQTGASTQEQGATLDSETAEADEDKSEGQTSADKNAGDVESESEDGVQTQSANSDDKSMNTKGAANCSHNDSKTAKHDDQKQSDN